MSAGSFQNQPARFRLGMAFPWRNRWFFGVSLPQLVAVFGCEPSKPATQGQSTASDDGHKRHIVLIGLRDSGKPVIQYGGNGMIIESGWSQTNNTNFQIEFKGQHRPVDAPFKLGDTNYQDSLVTGTVSRNATNDDLVTFDLSIDSKVPIQIQFQGIVGNGWKTNQNDTVVFFEPGQNFLTFYGKLVAAFEDK